MVDGMKCSVTYKIPRHYITEDHTPCTGGNSTRHTLTMILSFILTCMSGLH